MKRRKRKCRKSFISATAGTTPSNDINENKYFTRINQLLEEGWAASQMNPQTVDVDSKLENYLHKETFVSFVVLEKAEENK